MLAELSAQCAACLFDAVEQRVEIPERMEAIAVFGVDHAVAHVGEHVADASLERRRRKFSGLMVENLVCIVGEVEFEQLIVR